jgi:hypothetical protein
VLYFDDGLNQSLDWPPLSAQGIGGSTIDRPRAVEFTLELEDLGRVWRLIETKS